MTTLRDLLKRIDLEKDGDKMFIMREHRNHLGWDNVNFYVDDKKGEITVVSAGAEDSDLFND